MTDVADEITRRAFATRELRDMGIEPSPADLAAWLAMSPRQRDQARKEWAVTLALSAFTNGAY
jgi:transposase